MKYWVSIAVDGRIDVEVNADSFEEAKQKAEDAFMDAELSELEVIDSHPVYGCREDEEEIDYC